MTHMFLLLKRYRRETQALNGQYLAQGCTVGSHVGESRFQQATLNQNPHPHSKVLSAASLVRANKISDFTLPGASDTSLRNMNLLITCKNNS